MQRKDEAQSYTRAEPNKGVFGLKWTHTHLVGTVGKLPDAAVNRIAVVSPWD